MTSIQKEKPQNLQANKPTSRAVSIQSVALDEDEETTQSRTAQHSSENSDSDDDLIIPDEAASKKPFKEHNGRFEAYELIEIY